MADAAKLKILVVEDDAENRAAMVRVLESAGLGHSDSSEWPFVFSVEVLRQERASMISSVLVCASWRRYAFQILNDASHLDRIPLPLLIRDFEHDSGDDPARADEKQAIPL